MYRIAGILFFLFGCFLTLGHFLGGDQRPVGGGGVAPEYNNLITGVALFAIGLYVLIKCSGKRA